MYERSRVKVKVEPNSTFTFMHQSIPAAPASPLIPRELAFFLALDVKSPWVGTLELSNYPGWVRKKRANAPSSVNTAAFFIDRTVE